MQKAQGYVEQGNLVITVGGVSAAEKAQGSYPQATVNVYNAGTLVSATIYSDNSSTPKANPFTASTTGYFFFYAANGRYDVTFSGGGLASPLTFGDVLLADPFAAGGAVTSFNGRTGVVVPAAGDYPVSLGGTGATTLTGILEGHGTSAITGNAAALELLYLRRKPNNGATAAYEFAALPDYLAVDYVFTAQAPGGSLSIGSNTITLAPVPNGVNAADISHYLYISGGTGTAEAVLITGGTAVSGAASGTVIVTCANTHTGAWTIQSATGGGAEAHQAIITAGGYGTVRFTTPVTFYQGIYASSSSDRTSFQGAGLLTLTVTRAAGYTGSLFANTVSAAWTMRDLGITNPAGATGSAVYIGPGQITMDHVVIIGGQYGVRLVGAVSTNLNDVNYVNTDMTLKAVAGLTLDNQCINILVSNCQFIGAPVSNANVLSNGIRILDADGVWITNTVVSADYGVLISGTTNYIANVRFANLAVDQFRNGGVAFTGVMAMNNIRFDCGHLHGQSNGTTTGLGPVVYFAPGILLEEVGFYGTLIAGSAVEGVQILATGISNLTFCGASITDNNRSNAANLAGILIATGVSGVHIVGCTIGNTLGSGHQKYALSIAGTLTRCVITSNDFTVNTTEAVASATVAASWVSVVMGNNAGIDTAFAATVASANTISVGLYPMYTVTGTTVIKTMNGGWTGRRMRLAFNNALPAGIDATGNFYYAKTVTQNQQLECLFDGTKWACVGP